jgi:hypothetical protein
MRRSKVFVPRSAVRPLAPTSGAVPQQIATSAFLIATSTGLSFEMSRDLRRLQKRNLRKSRDR